MKKDKFINKIVNNRNTVLKKTTYRSGLENYLAFYGYGWYKMGITNNPERREKELNIYHFSQVKIISTIKVEGQGVFTQRRN